MATSKSQELRAETRTPVVRRPVAGFKYYIHDRASEFCLEIVGPLCEDSVPELHSCWDTARPTLGNRKLVINLNQVTILDDIGKQWVAAMVQETAICRPETFLRDAEAGLPGKRVVATRRISLIERIFNALRGCAAKA
jgi:hypothetical protein